MIIKQVELIEYRFKALRSMDKSLQLTFRANVTEDNNISTDEIQRFAHQPLVLKIYIDNNSGA
jgi:hypothetical protein